MQAAQLAVEIMEAGGDAGDVAVALEGLLGDLDRRGHGVLQRLQHALDLARLRQLIEPLLGRLDLLHRRQVEVVGEGLVDDLLAEVDEFAAQEEVVDGVAVVLGVDDGDDSVLEPREILGAAGLDQRRVLVEEVAQGQEVRDLPALDQRAGGLVDAAVQRIGEMLLAQELVDLVVDAVVGEDRAEQRLLGLVVVRRHARRRIVAAQGRDVAGSGQAAFHRSQTATLSSYSDSAKANPSRVAVRRARLSRNRRMRSPHKLCAGASQRAQTDHTNRDALRC